MGRAHNTNYENCIGYNAIQGWEFCEVAPGIDLP